jgi:hypothetical protein
MDEKLTTTEGSIYFRTILKEDVYNRLEGYAKTLATGRGHWDFGVAIERLLDLSCIEEQLIMLDNRLIILESNDMESEVKTEDKKETTLVGGHKLE